MADKPSKNDFINFEKFGLTEHKCEECGKEFECRGEYIYKYFNKKNNKMDYFCSWTCYRKRKSERVTEKELKDAEIREWQLNNWRL